jgi:hypothetical protein
LGFFYTSSHTASEKKCEAAICTNGTALSWNFFFGVEIGVILSTVACTYMQVGARERIGGAQLGGGVWCGYESSFINSFWGVWGLKIGEKLFFGGFGCDPFGLRR